MVQSTPSLDPIEAINTSFNKIFQFNGRSRRSEYWWTQTFILALNVLIPILVPTFFALLCLCLLDLMKIPLTVRRLHDTGRSGWWWGVEILLWFVFFICLSDDILHYVDVVLLSTHEPNLAVSPQSFVIDMLLDLFKHGIFFFAIMIYKLVLLIFCCLDSEPNENDYGDSPKYVESEY